MAKQRRFKPELQQKKNLQKEKPAAVDDGTISIFIVALILFFPPIGLVLFFFMRGKAPQTSKAIMKWTLIFTIMWILIAFIATGYNNYIKPQ